MSSEYVYVVEIRRLVGKAKNDTAFWRWRSWEPLAYHDKLYDAIRRKNVFVDSRIYQARIKKYKLVKDK